MTETEQIRGVDDCGREHQMRRVWTIRQTSASVSLVGQFLPDITYRPMTGDRPLLYLL